MANLSFRLLALIALIFSLGVSSLSLSQSNQNGPVVYVADVSGTIDLGLAPYIERVLKQAEQDGVAAVVLRINTFGGRVDAAVQIRDALLKSPVKSIAYIDSRAISAGALISLASTAIVMAPGGTIGAATPRAKFGHRDQPCLRKNRFLRAQRIQRNRRKSRSRHVDRRSHGGFRRRYSRHHRSRQTFDVNHGRGARGWHCRL